MTDHANPMMLDTSAAPYVLGPRRARSELSAEAEAAFYAMLAIVNRLESSDAPNPAKEIVTPAARNIEIAPQVTPRRNVEAEKPALNEKTPHSRIGASLLTAGFLGGALLGYALLTHGSGSATVPDSVLAGRQMQAAPLRAAEDIPAHHQSGSGHPSKFLVQIGSYKSQTDAMAAWSAFAHDHPYAGAHQPDIKTVDLGEKGVWHRLRLSNFSDQRAASLFCKRLKSGGSACLPGR